MNILRDFRIGWRSLLQDPASSLVVVAGLGVGFATALLLLGFVRYSWQYNAGVPDADRVYIVKQRYNADPKGPWFDQAPMLLRLSAARAPGVVASTAYIPTRPRIMGLTATIDGQLHGMNGLTVMPGFAEILGLRALQGNLTLALEQPESFAITEDAALRHFGRADIVGRTMLVEGKLLRAAAVLRTPDANTTIPFELLVGVQSVLADAHVKEEMMTGKAGWWGKVLVRVDPGASVQALTAALQQAVDQSPAVQDLPPETRQRLGQKKVMDVALSSLRDAYFDRDVGQNEISAVGERGNRVVIAALGAMAALILAMAAINYVNLAAVRMLRRQREVAMRKVLGAGMRQIVMQLLAESMLVALLATGLGLLLAWVALPLFARLVDRKLDGMLALGNIGAAVALGVALGALTAAYPAWIALRVRPGLVLAGRGDSESRRGMQLRRALTVVQVAAAMGITGITLAVTWQTGFAMRVSPGFDPAALLIVDLPDVVRDSARARNFIAALAAQPGVAGTAISEDAIGRHQVSWMRDLKRPGGASASMEMKSVSAAFFEQYRIAPRAGRLFSAGADKEDDPVPLVLNAIATRELGFATPEAALGQTLLFTGFDNKTIQKRVVGIAPQLRFQSLREAPHAMAYELWTAGMTLSVRASGELAPVEAAVRRLWPAYFPDAMVRTHRAGAILALNYAQDARLARILAIATCIALAMAAFGTYVLAAHTVQRRAREIVLRKLHGARRAAIGLLVVREIGALILVAAAIALPLAALAIARYLATFVEHAPIGYWTLLFALASTVAVALAAVARHAWLAMRMLPADALRG